MNPSFTGPHFVQAVREGSGGSLLMKEDDCLKSFDDGCCRDDVEAREVGVPVVYGWDRDGMAAAVNPLPMHLRGGGRKEKGKSKCTFNSAANALSGHWGAQTIKATVPGSSSHPTPDLNPSCPIPPMKCIACLL
ncbi:uncharacterized [Tachysurus ichikawai]